MFELEKLGYNKTMVNNYLVDVLKKIEEFERVINDQRDEIKSLEKRIEVLNDKKLSDNEDFVEEAKKMADDIINQVLLDMNDLDSRIHEAIIRELEK